MSSSALRLSLAVLSLCAAAVAVVLVRRRGEGEAPPDPAAAQSQLFALLAERAALGPPPPLAEELLPRREPIPPEVAARFVHQLKWPDHEYDPVLLYRWSAHVEREFAAPEHAGGHFTVRTNARGMRSPEPAEGHPDLRVLFAGDSQTEGYCDEAETFPALLRARLAAAHPELSIEVLNAACGGYSFYHHLATLERHGDLAPDVFVEVCFAGNDFGECLTLRHFYERLPPPGDFATDAATAARLKEVGGSFLNQGLLQADLLRRLPAERAVALSAARETAQAIGRLCKARGIRYVAVSLPPLWDAQPGVHAQELAAARGILALTDEDLALAGELAAGWRDAARAAGAEVVDLAGCFAAAGEPCFYRADHHLNVQGNARVAAALLPVLEGALR